MVLFSNLEQCGKKYFTGIEHFSKKYLYPLSFSLLELIEYLDIYLLHIETHLNMLFAIVPSSFLIQLIYCNRFICQIRK